MADDPSLDTGGDTGDSARVGPNRGPTTGAPTYPGTPRWVKVFGIVVLVLILLVAGVMVAGGGQHGPRRHMPAGAPSGPGGDTQPAAQALQGVQPA